MSWLFFALLSAVFAALTAIFAKIGLEGLDSDFATFIRTVFIVGIVALWVSFLGKWQSRHCRRQAVAVSRAVGDGDRVVVALLFQGVATGAGGARRPGGQAVGGVRRLFRRCFPR